ncbi:hypothetical protein [Gloeobacter kilaueensis]|uniref:Uncharacterized protein n=1 Tax=Gloeobacter kilaueensis (strain ATCC BAA-2537 / CCAP 1431/1 / ULC 316 / JS1) TaxID=1183438 RepID=U5QDD1_GLOK1|nr:hypothetical protein [Gloeobacter kilaueensis]AGY56886.1 hypothetical protein GKIL_0640 [Gloeobacter kilaueensis JS1]
MREPSYLLILAGIFALITAGAALQEMIKQAWLREEKPDFGRLLVPYLTMGAGLVALMASGLEIFGIPPAGAYGVSIVLVLTVAGFVWWRLTAELTGKGSNFFW